MTRIQAACLLALAGFATLATAGGESVAIVKNVSGSIVVQRDGGEVVASAGTPLFVADLIRSAPGASAGIVFKDGTLLTVGPATRVQVRDYVFEPKAARYAFGLYLDKGSAVYSSGKIGKLAPESVRLDSPTATVGVRGTRFIIRAE